MWTATVVLAAIVIAPCLLAVSEGLDGEPTVWNLVGLAYMVALGWARKKVVKWIKAL